MVKISWSRGWTSLLPPAGSGAAGGSLPIPRGKLRCIECIYTQMNVFNYTMQNAATPPKRRSILLSTTEGGKGHLPTGGLSASLPVHVAHPRGLARLAGLAAAGRGVAGPWAADDVLPTTRPCHGGGTGPVPPPPLAVLGPSCHSRVPLPAMSRYFLYVGCHIYRKPLLGEERVNSPGSPPQSWQS